MAQFYVYISFKIRYPVTLELKRISFRYNMEIRNSECDNINPRGMKDLPVNEAKQLNLIETM
jgi:hypothetical protein